MRIPNRLLQIYWTAVVALPVACGGDEPATEVLRPVRYTQVSTGGPRERTFSGAAHARVESRLSFRVAGAIQQLPVDVGDAVRVGQLIAELDPEDYRLQRQEAEAAVDRARAEARNAEANLERIRLLYENGNASGNDMDAARSASETAAAQVLAAVNRHDAARLQLSYTRLGAPAAGRISSVDVEVNENVRGGQIVAVLTSASELEVEVAVPEVLIARVREGARVTVMFDALPDSLFVAVVTEIGVTAGGLATTFPVTVRLDRTVEGLRPGMAAEVAFRFESTDQRERVIVPLVAVGEDRDGRFVFVVQRVDSITGLVWRRPVIVGEVVNEGFEILEGLLDEELVVTAGISRIGDGMRVSLPLPAGAGS